MCKGCEALRDTNSILLSLLERERERSDRLEGLLLNKTEDVSKNMNEMSAIPGTSTWSQLRRKLEAADVKKLNELSKVEL